MFTDYRGLTVAELSELRGLLREGSFEYRVVKNTLARIASEGTAVSSVKDSFKGPVGIAISYDDPVMPVKKILEYSKKNAKLTVGVGVIEGSVCTADDLRSVADTPPRHILLSMLAGGMQSPLNKLGGALHSLLAKFAYAMEALKQQKSKAE